MHLISHQIISDDEREKLFEAAELAKKMGVYKGKASVDNWHDREDGHDEGEVGSGDLWQAAREGDIPRIKYLLEVKKVPVNRSRWSGVTAMHRAAEEGRVDMIRLLAKAGGDVNCKTTWGWHTPLHLTCGRGHQDAGLELLNLGARWKITDKTHKTPLEWAINSGYPVMGRRLDQRAMRMEAEYKRDKHMGSINQKAGGGAGSAAAAAEEEKRFNEQLQHDENMRMGMNRDAQREAEREMMMKMTAGGSRGPSREGGSRPGTSGGGKSPKNRSRPGSRSK